MGVFDEIAAELVASELGEDVTYTPQSGAAVQVRAIPVNPARLEGLNPGQYTVRFVNASAFQAPPAAGDTVTIGSAQYRVFEVRNRGSGAAFLVLSKV